MEQAKHCGETRLHKPPADAVDLRILSLLQEDCRLSYSELARKTGISVGTAYNRVRKLETESVLKNYTILVDIAKIGYSLTGIILVQVEGGRLTDVENKIAEASSVIAVYDITGEYDALVIARFKDRNGLSMFIKHVLAMPHVKRTITCVALTTVKEDFRLKFDEK
jgi:DNA-binding Lrp family transcriptional regulator